MRSFDPFAGPALTLAAPTTQSQREIWTATRMGEEASLAFNESSSLHLRGDLDVAALRVAVQALIARHEALRTTFSSDGMTLCVTAEALSDLPLVDFTGLEEAERAAKLGTLLRREVEASFSLEQGPLFRAKLVRTALQDHVLVMTAHHIVCDGWSTAVLLQDLAALYGAAKRNEVPELKAPCPFSAFAHEQRVHVATEEHRRGEVYWTSQFDGPTPVLELPTDTPRPALRTYASLREDIVLPKDLVERLKKTGARAGCSFFAVLLSAFEVLLHRLSGQEDIVVGVPAAGQVTGDYEGLVGHCVNTLPIRAHIDATQPFATLLKAQRTAVLDAFEHQAHTLGSLLEKLAVQRGPSRPPLVQVLFNLDQALPADALRWDGLEVEFSMNPRRFENFELFVNAVEKSGAVVFECQYNTGLFRPETIRRWFSSLQVLLEGVAEDPEQAVAGLPILSSHEQTELAAWNDTVRDYPSELCAHELIERQVDLTPEATAIVCGDATIGYRDLDARANRLARRLRALGVTKDVLVGLYLERSIDMVVALLAVLKAGGAYVPLDPAFPSGRIAFMVSDAQPLVIVTETALRDALPAHDAKVLCLEDDAGVDHGSDARLERQSTPESLAYVIYTSGSSGKPKGVELPHRAVVNFLWSVAREPGLEASDVLLAVTTLSFDIAVLELFLPLIVGAKIVVATRELVSDGAALLDTVRRHHVTAMQATPATWRVLLAAGWSHREPMKVLCGGEALPLELARALVDRGTSVWNMYGPTETTVWSTLQRIDHAAGHSGTALIGRPLANTRAYVLDAFMHPVPVGVSGQLCIGGDGLARGYLRRPELTAERFVPDPFDPSLRVYQTGDLVRRLPSGELEYLGRNDNQVKLRGHRIELGEIEAALALHPGVAQAVALVREVVPGDARLIAYVVPRADSASDDALRDHLRAFLPAYMVPQHFVALAMLPLTPNGKIDRKALPPFSLGSPSETASYVPPRTPTESMIAEVWGEALGVGRVSVHDDFFRLGGHSLLAAQVLSRLARDHGIALSLRRIFEAPTVAALATLVDTHSKDAGTEALVIPPRRGTEPARQSFMQQRLWFLEQMDPGQTAYNLPAAFRMRGRLDAGALERSLAAIVQRHEALRTTLAFDGEQPVQIVAPSLDVHLGVVDLAHLPHSERETEVLARIQGQTSIPFDLTRGPLFAVTLYRLAYDEHMLFFMPHHAIWDGWSFDAFLRELEAHYAAFAMGREPRVPTPPIQYADFSTWHLDWLRGEQLDKQSAYWKERLAGELLPLDLPTDRPRPRVLSGRGGFEPLVLTPDERDALAGVARASNATLYMVMLTAFFTLLHRYTGKSDLLVGTPVRGRTQPQTEDLLGFFVNTLVMRADLGGTPTFRELLARVRATCLEDFAHPDMPFELLVRELGVPRDLSTTPVFQALFSYQDASARKDTLGDLELTQIHVMPEAAQTELTLWVMDRTDGMVGGVSYSTDLFDPSTIRRFISHFRTLLGSVARDPNLSVATIAIVPEAELARFAEWNGVTQAFPRDACAHELIEQHVARTPDAVAVVCGDASLTYAELDARANRLARRLRAHGVRREVLVGICLERSLEMVIALLAVLKAGGAYLPLDPGLPDERLGFMAEDANLGVLLTTGELSQKVSAPGAQRVLVDDDSLDVSADPMAKDDHAATPSSCAYVIYTSGSTGKPKGVFIRHSSLVNLLVAMEEKPGFTKDDVAIAMATLSFDMAVAELYVPLAVGAKVVVVGRETAKDGAALLEVVRKTRPPAPGTTILHATPSTFRILLDAGWSKSEHPMRAICGGEALLPDLARAMTERSDDVWNGYGPTETTVYSTFWRIPREVSRVLIGGPIANAQCHVLDERLERVPIGVPGELCIGGEGVGRSYLGRPELTGARFVHDPFATEPGARMYRTGDVVRWMPCGALEHLGRNDGQVKVRGFRIELGEIEIRLAEHPSVDAACVVVRRYAEDDTRLVAYYVSAAGETVTRTDLRRHLRRVLPDYMVPHTFVELAALPRNPSGKIDRGALPAPFEDARPEGAFVAPRTDSERLVAEIWGELLRVREVGIHDNFFDLGGHSLLVLRAIAVIERRTGTRANPRSFVLDTLEQFAAQLSPVSPPLHDPKGAARKHDGASKLATRLLDRVTRSIFG